MSRQSTLSLDTNPSGLEIRLDGQPFTTPFSTISDVGTIRTLEAPTPQTMDGNSYEFQSWSNGVAPALTIVTPSTDTTYTATYSSFDYSISVDITSYSFAYKPDRGPRGSGLATQGGSVSIPVTTTLVSGTPESVTFSASGLPSGATASFSPVRCDSGCSAILTIYTSDTTPIGTYTINILGVSDSQLRRYTAYTLFIENPSSVADLWQRAYGGAGDDWTNSVQGTRDGGYILAGRTESFGAGTVDVYVLKVDQSGNVQWSKTYGGGEWDIAYSVQQTSDGGYIVGGMTKSFGAGGADFYALKLDPSGNVEWSRAYGERGYEEVKSIIQTSDGGYILAGWTHSALGPAVVDLLIVKVDQSGNVQWSKAYGGGNAGDVYPEGVDDAYSIQQTPDGGYIVGGYTTSFGAGAKDIYLLKLDTAGDLQWSKTYGGEGYDEAYSVQLTTDGGYVLFGRTNSFGASNYDLSILKVDQSGNVQWSKAYGGNGDEFGWSGQQTVDGGYIAGGWSASGGGGWKFYVLKVDASGNLQWSKTYRGGVAYSIDVTEQGYVAAGQTNSFGSGAADSYLVKMDSLGNCCDEQDASTFVSDVTPRVSNPSTVVINIVISTSSGTNEAQTGSGTNNEVSSFDFSISISRVSGIVTQGGSASIPVTTTLTSGTTEPVDFSASGLPSGATSSFSPVTCDPDCSATLTIYTSSATPPGTYTINISASSKEVTRTTSYTLIINAPPAEIINTPPAEVTTCEDLGITDIRAIGNDGNIPTNTIDNDLGTRWSNLGIGSWIVYDLGGQRDLCNVDIAWYTGDRRTNSFVISASSDGSTYTNIYTGSSSGTTLLPEKYDLPDVNARYVRITVNGNTQNDWASITEVDIYGDSTTNNENDDTTNSADTISPTIIAPVDITTEGNGALTHIPLGTPYVSDNVDPSPSVTNNAPAGGFPRGTVIVTWRATDDSGNSATDTQSVTIVDAPTVDSSSTVDKFGVKEIHPTKAGGREWFSRFDVGPTRTFGSGGSDPFDPEAHGTGVGSYTVGGESGPLEGILRMTGTFPRLYIMDPAEPKWQNVEITWYGSVNSIAGASSWHGMIAGTRSEHHNAGTSATQCNARTYYARPLFNSGGVDFEKEMSHGATSINAQMSIVSLFPGGFPLNDWLGFKFIVRNSGSNVILELWYDDSAGLNGGNWRLIREYNDNANRTWWVSNPCYPRGTVYLDGGTSTFFRTDSMIGGKHYDMKWVSIREVNPI